MNGTRAAFAAYFSRSALLDLRGTGYGWLICTLGFIAAIPWSGESSQSVFWALFALILPANQFAQFLHRLSGKAVSNLVPNYRRCLWRAFMANGLLLVLFSTVPFVFIGLPLMSGVAIALFAFSLIVWAGFHFRYAMTAIAFAVFPLIFFGLPAKIWLLEHTVWVMIAGVVGLVLLYLAGRQYMAGDNNRAAEQQVQWISRRRKEGTGFELSFLNGINQWLFACQLKRVSGFGNKLNTLASAYYTPIWNSGIPAVLIFLVFAGGMGIVFVQLGNGEQLGELQLAIRMFWLMTCFVVAIGTAGMFEINRDQWVQYWMVLPAKDRQAWVNKIVAAYFLVQARNFLFAGLVFVIMSLAAGMSVNEFGPYLVIALNVFLITSGTTLMLEPTSGYISPLVRRVFFFFLLAVGFVMGLVGVSLFSERMHLLEPLAAGIAGAALWGVALLLIGVSNLLETELTVKDQEGVNASWGM